jgi:hypothetical protein
MKAIDRFNIVAEVRDQFRHDLWIARAAKQIAYDANILSVFNAVKVQLFDRSAPPIRNCDSALSRRHQELADLQKGSATDKSWSCALIDSLHWQLSSTNFHYEAVPCRAEIFHQLLREVSSTS